MARGKRSDDMDCGRKLKENNTGRAVGRRAFPQTTPQRFCADVAGSSSGPITTRPGAALNGAGRSGQPGPVYSVRDDSGFEKAIAPVRVLIQNLDSRGGSSVVSEACSLQADLDPQETGRHIPRNDLRCMIPAARFTRGSGCPR